MQIIEMQAAMHSLYISRQKTLFTLRKELVLCKFLKRFQVQKWYYTTEKH